MTQSPWHRHVSPIFFLLLVVAGLMVGFVAFFLLPEVAHAVRGWPRRRPRLGSSSAVPPASIVLRGPERARRCWALPLAVGGACMSKKKAKKRLAKPQRELNDLHAGIRAALRYHLKSGADPLEAVELVAANLDEQGRHEMIELGLLAMIEALSARDEH